MNELISDVTCRDSKKNTNLKGIKPTSDDLDVDAMWRLCRVSVDRFLIMIMKRN